MNRNLLKIIVSILLTSISVLAFTQSNDLKDHKWKNRVVLLFAPSKLDAELIAQQDIIENSKLEFLERDLIVRSHILGDNNGQDLRRKFKVQEDKFTFILIGKDGGEKLTKNEVVHSKDLFDLIDSMPMRQSEMKRKKR